MTNSEHAPQPPDLLAEARTYDSFDNWLTHTPDERLHNLIEIAQQVEAEVVEDETALAHMLGVAMHFSGKEALSIPEVSERFMALAAHVALEIHVREGTMTKEGAYSLIPEEETAVMVLTEQGREKYKQERNP